MGDARRAPSGTVTFLFTDIEGSTRAFEEHPAEMQDVVARQEALLTEAVESHGGYVVKFIGDSVYAAFASARDATDAAVSGQLAIAEEPWPPNIEVRVRMGLHAGEAVLRDGDYFGSEVNRAARITATAHGGQIVCSRAVVELGGGGEGAIDLGEHRLRDVGSPMGVFQVCAPGLPTDFPPLRSLAPTRGNLPAQPSSLLGRDDEVVRTAQLLERSTLVTLVGPGGVGKTRLAIHVATERQARVADGAWICDLSSARDADAMAQVVVATLGCVQRPGLSVVDSIAEYVKVRELLLVLDNCEHLLDEVASLVEAVRATSPRVTVLATSREALLLTGEQVVRLRPLATPEVDADVETIERSPSVRLFLDRAASSGVPGGVSGTQLSAIAEICRRVDGIPLAIELAAGRVESMRPREIAARLDERFRLLTGTRRGRVERHQTLRATVDWSYQLLDDAERLVFVRLGVFSGTFDASGAIAIAAERDDDDWTVVEALAGLVGKSMLVVEDGPDDTTRYRMFETLRQFARERLEESGDADRLRRAHAEHFAAFAAQAGVGLRGPDEFGWVRRFHLELENIRAAVEWGLDGDEPGERELAVRILAPFAYGTNPTPAVNALAARAVSAARECSPELRAPVLALAAHHELNHGMAERARALAAEAMRDGILPGSPNPYSPHIALGLIELTEGNAERTLELYEEARANFDRVDDPWSQAFVLGGLASFEAMLGRIEQATADADASLEVANRLRNPTAVANALQGKAWALLRDEPGRALEVLEQFIEIHRDGLGHGGAAVGTLAMAGALHHRFGDSTTAIHLFEESVLLARDMGALPQLSAALDWSLGPLVRLGRPELAVVLVGALSAGVLADAGNFPLVAATRARNLDRARAQLGDDVTEELLARGRAMTFDDVVAYALEHLR